MKKNPMFCLTWFWLWFNYMMNTEHDYDFIKFYVSFPITVLTVIYMPNTLGFAC